MPPIFRLIADKGGIAVDEMHRTFNMGVGMVIVTSPENLTRLEAALTEAGEMTSRIGEIRKGTGIVVFR